MALNPKLKWWILPPAAALVLFLGPFQARSKPAVEPAATDPAPAAEATPETRSTPEPVKIPDTWQVVSTLLGVLLLGGVGIVLVAKLRNASPRGGGNFVTLRQSLRLGSRHSVHAIEFDDEILLLGECDGNLSVVHRGPRDQVIADEAEVLAREDDEEGAVPKNLVIPRPAKKATAAPTPPSTPKTKAPKPAPTPKPQSKPLSDFRALMRRVKAGQS